MKVWREDEGPDSAVEYDMADAELAACKFADDDVDGGSEGDYWGNDLPVVVVEDVDGKRTRWRVEATVEHVAWPED